MEIYMKLASAIGTPFMIVTTNNGKVLLTHAGMIEDLDETLVKIREFHKQVP